MNVLPRIQSFTCPCCGGFLGEAAPLEMVSEKVARGHHEKVLALLSTRMGRLVSKDALIDHLYSDDPDGGPDTADGLLSVVIFRLKQSIEPFGWTITSIGRGSGNKASYRLIPMVAGQ